MKRLPYTRHKMQVTGIKKLFFLLGLVISILFCLTLIIILLCSIMADGGEYSMNQSPSLALVILLAVLICGVIFLTYSILVRKKQVISLKKEVLLVGGLMAVILGLQVLIGHFLSVSYSWDPNELYWAISPIFEDNTLGNVAYLSHFPYQMMLLNMSVAFIGVAKFFGIGLSIHALWTAMNIIAVTSSFLLIYLILRKMFNVQVGVFGLVLATLFTPLLLYIPITYTDTISMPFILLAFYLFLWLIDGKVSLRKRLILSCVFAVAIFLAFNIKASSGILFIAMLLYCILTFDKNYLRQFVCYAGIFLVVVTPLTLLYKYEQATLLDANLKVPTTHWIMMGMNNGEFTGGWSGDDYRMTYRAMSEGKTSQELQSMHVDEITKRLTDYGLFGYIGFLSKKISYTWGDGTYTVSDQLNKLPTHPDSLAFKLFARDGNMNSIYLIFANAMQLSMLIILLWGGCVTIRHRGVVLILKMTLIGVFVFFLVWETTSRYLLNYLPIFIVLTVYLIDQLTRNKRFMIKWVHNEATKNLESKK